MCIVIFTYVATTSELRFAFSSLIGGFCISYFQHSFLFYFVQRDLVVRVYVKKEIVYFPCFVCTVLQAPATLVMVRNTQDHGKMVFLTEMVASLLIYFEFVFLIGYALQSINGSVGVLNFWRVSSICTFRHVILVIPMYIAMPYHIASQWI